MKIYLDEVKDSLEEMCSTINIKKDNIDKNIMSVKVAQNKIYKEMSKSINTLANFIVNKITIDNFEDTSILFEQMFNNKIFFTDIKKSFSQMVEKYNSDLEKLNIKESAINKEIKESTNKINSLEKELENSLGLLTNLSNVVVKKLKDIEDHLAIQPVTNEILADIVKLNSRLPDTLKLNESNLDKYTQKGILSFFNNFKYQVTGNGGYYQVMKDLVNQYDSKKELLSDLNSYLEFMHQADEMEIDVKDFQVRLDKVKVERSRNLDDLKDEKEHLKRVLKSLEFVKKSQLELSDVPVKDKANFICTKFKLVLSSFLEEDTKNIMAINDKILSLDKNTLSKEEEEEVFKNFKDLLNNEKYTELVNKIKNGNIIYNELDKSKNINESMFNQLSVINNNFDSKISKINKIRLSERKKIVANIDLQSMKDKMNEELIKVDKITKDSSSHIGFTKKFMDNKLDNSTNMKNSLTTVSQRNIYDTQENDFLNMYILYMMTNSNDIGVTSSFIGLNSNIVDNINWSNTNIESMNNDENITNLMNDFSINNAISLDDSLNSSNSWNIQESLNNINENINESIANNSWVENSSSVNSTTPDSYSPPDSYSSSDSSSSSSSSSFDM